MMSVPKKDLTRDASALSLRATFQPKSVNPERRTADLVWTTGAKVLRADWDGQFFEELSLDPKHVRMTRLNNGAPFLHSHDSGRQIGVVESARLEGSQGTATVRFPSEGVDSESDKMFRLISEGIVQNVSVGYRVHKVEKTDDAKVPTFRATDWEPFEISAVAMGADDGAGFRSLTRGQEPQLERKMSDQNGGSNEGGTAPVVPAPVADVAARTAELEAAATRAVEAERTRVSGVRAACSAARMDQAFTDRLAADGACSVEKARALVLEEMAKRTDATTTNQTVKITDDNRDKFVRGASAWLFERGSRGLVQQAVEKKVKGFAGLELDGGEFRGMTLVDLAKECLRRNGISTVGLDRFRIAQLALKYRASGSSTSDFAVLFENVMYKQMLAAYAFQADTWRRFCRTDVVADYRDANRFRNGSFGVLDVVQEGEEYPNRAIPDGEKVSISVQKYGGTIKITREALINDDMGALADLSSRFGRGAASTIEKAVYALLAENNGLGPDMADSQPFFHANRANVSGASGAISALNLDADKITMRSQVDPTDNEFLELMPSILLVPVGLESTAKILNTDAFDPDQEGQMTNSARGMFNDIVSSPRLTASTTRRYVFTAAKEAFVVVFLEGQGENPVMESEESFLTDGLTWKARLEFKAQPFDPRQAVTAAGT